MKSLEEMEVITVRLAICASDEGINAEVDQRFGRCKYFVIVDSDTGEIIEVVPNENAVAFGGAGPRSAQLLAEKSVDAVLLGNVGPNAANALEAAKIMVFSGIEGTVGSTLEKFKSGSLVQISEATGPSHQGMDKNG
jgi:predicted Fe-Mo cluster-binding NifX family protein